MNEPPTSELGGAAKKSGFTPGEDRNNSEFSRFLVGVLLLLLGELGNSIGELLLLDIFVVSNQRVRQTRRRVKIA